MSIVQPPLNDFRLGIGSNPCRNGSDLRPGRHVRDRRSIRFTIGAVGALGLSPERSAYAWLGAWLYSARIVRFTRERGQSVLLESADPCGILHLSRGQIGGRPSVI